ncbi:MAG: Rieske (2Fe-2S) protein [Thermoplasmata archaeon]|jgi:nitrite reductase/ring-hydroxylating ferredoxin subunit
MAWQKTGVAVDTIALGTMREVLVGATSVLLVRTTRGLFAIESVYPHLGGLLADGMLSEHRLTCPEHAAVFDVTTGKVLADPFGVEPPEGAVDALRPYPTRVEAGMVEVDLPAD